ncbi:hypothetical protein V6N12_048131 [Hibiscus sabdariffa]|uniref:Uncharacterized protein n=1 Tax=Hibiscus sabdariffa TaxID=183260 RepID=A0ABR2EGD6_9ROSI
MCSYSSYGSESSTPYNTLYYATAPQAIPHMYAHAMSTFSPVRAASIPQHIVFTPTVAAPSSPTPTPAFTNLAAPSSPTHTPVFTNLPTSHVITHVSPSNVQ